MTGRARRAGFAEVNGARIHYELLGSGPPVVLLHAGIADRRMWDEQMGPFAQHFQVLRYDMRGLGRTETPAGTFTHHADLRGLLQALGIARAHLVGLSKGARIAINVALEYPGMVERLVLAAPGLEGYSFSDATRQTRQALEAEAERDGLPEVELDIRVWVAGSGRPIARVDPAIAERIRLMHVPDRAFPPGHLVEQMLEPPAVERIGEIRAPALIITGELDVPDINAIAALLVARIPGAESAMVPGVAHMINMEQPETFNRLVVDFLRG